MTELRQLAPIRVDVSAARGASVAEIARKTGQIAGLPVSPTDSDQAIIDKQFEAGEEQVELASIAAAAAQATARYFTTRAAGEAGSAVNQAFATDDGAGNVIYYRRTADGSVEIGRALTPAALAATTGAGLVGWIKGVAEAVARTVASLFEERISVADFGAKFEVGTKPNDDPADDTVAVQKAINYAVAGKRFAQKRAAVIRVPGLCKISEPLKINFPEGTFGRIRFVADGVNGGFYTDQNINIFENDISTSTVPSGNFVEFDHIHFEADNDGARIMSGQFLRVTFTECVGLRIKLVATNSYLQTWQILGGFWRGWAGNLISCHYSYDVAIKDAEFTQGGSVFVDDAVATGLTIDNVTAQGISGSLVDVARSQGVYVGGATYTETNGGIDYIFDRPSYSVTYFNTNTPAVSNGVSFQGNIMLPTEARAADPTKFQVDLGDVRGFQGGGNHCSGRLYDTRQLTQAADLSGDTAGIELYSGYGGSLLTPGRAAKGAVIGRDRNKIFSAYDNAYTALGGDLQGYEINGTGAPVVGSLNVTHAPNAGFFGNFPFKRGSIIWNSTPAVGQPIGWMCTVSGDGSAPATFVAMANL